MQRIFGVLLLIGSLSASLAASEISGTFTLDGIVTVANTGLTTWTNGNTFISNQATIGSGPTGSFAGLDGQTVDINDLNSADQTVGTSFTNYNFIDFTADPAFPELLANYIPAGTGGSLGCFVSPGSGETCTPSSSPLTSFTFLNTSSSTSSATWDISGVTSDGLSSWNALITMDFSASYQEVLAEFTTTGSISDTYTAAVTVSELPPVSTVPEPATLPLMAAGLVLLAWLARRSSLFNQR